MASTSCCWASPLGLGTTELQQQDKSHLHLGTAGAHSQVVALFDPGHRRYVVPRLLHLQQLQNVTSASTPQVHAVVQSHRQHIPRAPVHKVQVCRRGKGRARAALFALALSPPLSPAAGRGGCTYSSHSGFQGRPGCGLAGKGCNGRSSCWSPAWPSGYRVLLVCSGNLWQQSESRHWED